MSLLFPTLPKQPGLTAWYSALLYTSIHLYSSTIGSVGEVARTIGCRRYGIGDPGWGPGTKHLDLFLYVLLFLWGGNHAASRRPVGVYTHTHIGQSKEQGQAHY